MQDVDVGAGIQTNGYVLKWDTSVDLFVPGEADSSISGINTTGTSYFNDVEVSGDLDVSGDLVYDEATARNWNVTGIATANRLFVNSDARILGILTVGESSITLDGDNNNVNIGTGVTIYGATGIVSAITLQDSAGAKLSEKASIGLAIALG